MSHAQPVSPHDGASNVRQRRKTRESTDRSDRKAMPLPRGIERSRVRWSVTMTILGFHVLAFAAVAPWLFSWSGLILACVGVYVFGVLGINVCYHRLLTHRSFACPRWLEWTMTLLALCNLQGSSVRWVSTHRAHHQHSDDRPDPHSPLVDFLWSHIGWLFVSNPDTDSEVAMSRYAADLYRDPFHFWLQRKDRWLWVPIVHVFLFFGAGMIIGWLIGGRMMGGVQLGLSWVVWAVCLRLVVLWHVTWAINSVTHLWGYRSYETDDNSRNNWLLGYLGMGEGWHNNHHADQRSAAHGHRWWELDVTYLTIRLLNQIGLASNLMYPSRHDSTRHDLRGKATRK